MPKDAMGSWHGWMQEKGFNSSHSIRFSLNYIERDEGDEWKRCWYDFQHYPAFWAWEISMINFFETERKRHWIADQTSDMQRSAEGEEIKYEIPFHIARSRIEDAGRDDHLFWNNLHWIPGSSWDEDKSSPERDERKW